MKHEEQKKSKAVSTVITTTTKGGKKEKSATEKRRRRNENSIGVACAEKEGERRHTQTLHKLSTHIFELLQCGFLIAAVQRERKEKTQSF